MFVRKIASRFKLASLDASEIPRGKRHSLSDIVQFEISRPELRLSKQEEHD